MKAIGHLQLVLAVAGMSVLLTACRSTRSGDEPLTPASSSESNAAVPETSEGDQRTCQSNEDCGPGYECGFDHARSHIVRYCLAE